MIRFPSSRLHPGEGFEMGRFRLRPGATEDALKDAMRHMEETVLAVQPGFRGHHVVALGDGWYLDITIADDRAAAERLCAAWAGQPACEAVLALIEVPENALAFGHVVM